MHRRSSHRNPTFAPAAIAAGAWVLLLAAAAVAQTAGSGGWNSPGSAATVSFEQAAPRFGVQHNASLAEVRRDFSDQRVIRLPATEEPETPTAPIAVSAPTPAPAPSYIARPAPPVQPAAPPVATAPDQGVQVANAIAALRQYDAPPIEDLPPPAAQGFAPAPPAVGMQPEIVEGDSLLPTFGEVWGEDPFLAGAEGSPFQDWQNWLQRHYCELLTGEPGIGRERVALAPFQIDITQPMPNIRLRFDSVYDLRLPNRSEYFWARPGRGPTIPERKVSYQDMRFLWEAGNNTLSVATEIPIRTLDPDFNGNTAGVGDISITQKLLMMNGNRWQVTQILRTTMPSGNARKGLGTGHVSMEPGALFRYKWSEITYLHSQLTLNIPIGGTPMWSAPVVRSGIGVSHLWYDSDTFALIPTLELVYLGFLDGFKQPFPPAGNPVDVQGDPVFYLSPGLRMVCDTGGDLGLVEFGIHTGRNLGTEGWFNNFVSAELRFSY